MFQPVQKLKELVTEIEVIGVSNSYLTYLFSVNFQILHRLTPLDEDRESLKQVEGVLRPLQVDLNSPEVSNLIKRFV